jgi:hypothetical protein
MKIFVGHKPDRKHIQALYRCKHPESEALLDLFKTKLDEIKTALILAEDPVRIHRLQGRAEALTDFLEAVEKSQEVLARLGN